MIITNMQGNGIPDPNGLAAFSITTIGNIGDSTSNYTSLELPGCDTYNRLLGAYFMENDSCLINKEILGRVYAWIDVIATAFLVIACYWLREFESVEVHRLERSNFRLADYTIYAPWVPPNTTEENLKKYFEKLSRRYLFAPEHKSNLSATQSKIKDRIQKREKGRHQSHLVQEVHMCYDTSDVIETWKKIGQSKFERFRIGKQIQYWKSRAQHHHKALTDVTCCERLFHGEYSEKDIKSLEVERKKKRRQEEEWKHILKNKYDDDSLDYGEPCGAFITFQYIEVRDLVMKNNRYGFLQRIFLRKWLSAFPPSWRSWCLGCCVKNEKDLFMDSFALRMKTAPSASTIVWENMKFRTFARFGRRSATSILCVFMIFIATLIAAYMETIKESVRQTDELLTCPFDWDDKSNDEKIDYVTEHPDYIHCYCGEVSYAQVENYDICTDYHTSSVYNLCLSMGAVFMFTAVNMAVTYMINKLAKGYEKHHSLDGQEVSIFNRTFILKYLNSACLYLVVNIATIREITGYEGPGDNFGVIWYQDLAPLLMFLMVSNVVSPHMSVVYRYYKLWKGIKIVEENTVQDTDASRKTDDIFCQEDLDAKYKGPDFHLNFRYSQLIVNFYMAVMYSTGIPILIPIAAVQAFVTYWVDLFMFTKFYRSPPNYSSYVASSASKLCEYGVALHLGFAIWIMISGDIFLTGAQATHAQVKKLSGEYADSTFYYKVTQKHVWPLTVFFFLFAVFFISKELFTKVNRVLLMIFRFITCRAGETVHEHEIEAPRCDIQVRRHRFGAISDYNILNNPLYQDAFRIPRNWARKGRHQHLKSLRLFDAERKSDVRSSRDITPTSKTTKMAESQATSPLAIAALKQARASQMNQPAPHPINAPVVYSEYAHL